LLTKSLQYVISYNLGYKFIKKMERGDCMLKVSVGDKLKLEIEGEVIEVEVVEELTAEMDVSKIATINSEVIQYINREISYTKIEFTLISKNRQQINKDKRQLKGQTKSQCETENKHYNKKDNIKYVSKNKKEDYVTSENKEEFIKDLSEKYTELYKVLLYDCVRIGNKKEVEERFLYELNQRRLEENKLQEKSD